MNYEDQDEKWMRNIADIGLQDLHNSRSVNINPRDLPLHVN